MMLPVNMCPDPCVSESQQQHQSCCPNSEATPTVNIVASSDSSAVSVTTTVTPDVLDKEHVLPSLLSDEETELDHFLLDAVNWL